MRLAELDTKDVALILGIILMLSGIERYDWRAAIIALGLVLVAYAIVMARPDPHP